MITLALRRLSPREVAWLLSVMICLAMTSFAFYGQFTGRLKDVLPVLVLSTLTLTLTSAAIIDLSQHKIPNWITYPAFGLALILNLFGEFLSDPDNLLGSPTSSPFVFSFGIWQSLLGALVCFLIMLAIHSTSQGGAGDVKLATAIGALIGVRLGVLTICYSFLLAGVVAVAVAILVLGPQYVLRACFSWIGSRLFPLMVEKPNSQQLELLQRPLPLGVFFAVGTMLAIVGLPGVSR